MADRMHNPAPQRARPRGRRGFSFAEVMFAVIILAIGFILVAAIFPVAIQQTQSTAEDAAAAAAAREAANAITGLPTAVPNPLYSSTASAGTAASIPQLLLFPPTVKNYVPPTTIGTGAVPPPAIVVPFTGPRAEMARGNLVNASDPRYAYVPFYRRENGSSVAQLILVAVTARNRPVFDPNVDAVVPSKNAAGNPYAGPTGNTITQHTIPSQDATHYTICPDLITLASQPGWAGEGCPLLTSPVTGRSFRLGRCVTAASPLLEYELDPGDNLSVAPGSDGLWGSYGTTATDPTNDVIDTTGNANAVMPPSTLQPVGAYARIFSAAGSLAGRITLSANLPLAVTAEADAKSGTADPANGAPLAAVPGTFVIVADDYPYDATAPTTTNILLPLNVSGGLTVGALNGRIFRLGQAVPANGSAVPPVDPGTFELDPQFATVPAGTSLLVPINGAGGPRARVYLVGAGRTNALSTTDTTPAITLTTYSGTAQDTGVYTTFFPVQ